MSAEYSFAIRKNKSHVAVATIKASRLVHKRWSVCFSAVRKRLVCPAQVSFRLGRVFSITGVTCCFQRLRIAPWESLGNSRGGSMVVSIERYMGVFLSVSMCICIGYSTCGSMGCYVGISMDSTIRTCASSFMGDYAGHYEGGYKGCRTGASIGRFMRGCWGSFWLLLTDDPRCQSHEPCVNSPIDLLNPRALSSTEGVTLC